MSLRKFIYALAEAIRAGEIESREDLKRKTDNQSDHAPTIINLRAILELPEALVNAYQARYLQPPKKKIWRIWKRILTVATCLAVIVYTVAAIWQLKTMRHQLNAMQADQRPWAGISGIRIENDLPVTGGTLLITFVMVNSGKTPALNLQQQTSVVVGAENPEIDWNRERRDANPIVVFPGINGIASSTSTDISAQNAVRYRTPGTIYGIYARAHVTYDDVLGCHHFTDFCGTHKFGEAWATFGFCKFGNNVDTKPDCEAK